MTKNDDAQLWLMAKDFIIHLNRESSPTKKEIDELYARLPARKDDETVFEWLHRVWVNKPESKPTSIVEPNQQESNVIFMPKSKPKPLAHSVLTCRAAADGKLRKTLERRTDDSRYLIIANQLDDIINIKVKAQGAEIVNLRKKGAQYLELTCNALEEAGKNIVILLEPTYMQGEIAVPAIPEWLELLFSQDTTIKLKVYDTLVNND